MMIDVRGSKGVLIEVAQGGGKEMERGNVEGFRAKIFAGL